MDAPTTEIPELNFLRNTMLVFSYLISTGFVLLLLLGYTCLEVGLVHTKNAINLMLMKFVTLFICGFMFYIIGYCLAAGKGNSVVGTFHYWPVDNVVNWSYDVSFTAIATSLITGAVAERCRFPAFIIYTLIVSGFTYPICVRWAWMNNGFLKRMDYIDTSGRGTIHIYSGVSSFVAAWMMGPRKGRFVDGKVMDLPGHSLSLMVFGTLLIIPCEIGFGLELRDTFLKPDPLPFSQIPINLCVICSSTSMATLFLSKFWLTRGYWGFTLTILSSISGVAAASTCSLFVRGWEACVVGIGTSLIYLFCHFLMLNLEIDDAVDVVATHFGGGISGILISTVLTHRGYILERNLKAYYEILVNITGIVIITFWSAITSLIIFGVLHLAGILRVRDEAEETGLDLSYHGKSAYDAEAYPRQTISG